VVLPYSMWQCVTCGGRGARKTTVDSGVVKEKAMEGGGEGRERLVSYVWLMTVGSRSSSLHRSL
jgi:hypothetical protein